MTITVVYASSGDGYLDSQHATYSGMFNGTSVSLVAGGNAGFYGRNNNSGQYRGFEPFMTFTYSAVTDQVTAAYVRLRTSSVVGTGVTRALYLASYSYGTLAAADWRTPAQHSALPRYVTVEAVNGSTGKYIYGGSDLLATAVAGGTTIELAGMSSLQYSGTAPTQDEGASFYLSEQTGTSQDPALVFTTVARSRLWPVLGACAQLTDGTWAYLESDGASTPTITLKHCSAGGVVTTVATVPTGTGGLEFYVGGPMGAQGLALVCDPQDNLYVVGKVGNASNSLAAKGYVHLGGTTWSAQTTRSWPLASYPTQINNVAAAYNHSSGGVLVCLFGHGPGTGIGGSGGNELAYAILDATFLRTGAGSLMKDHGSAMTVGLQPSGVDAAVFNAYANEVGTGLDVARALATVGTNAAWGYVASFTKEQNIGDNFGIHPGRYIVDTAGTSFSHASTDDGGYALKDAGGKIRAVAVSSSTVAYLTADSDAGWGLTVQVMQYSGTNPGGVELAYDALADNGITNMPDGPAIGAAAWWDAVYNSVSNTLEIYFRDSSNSRVLRRTTFSLTTMLALNNSAVVHTVASGTAEIQAVRVARGGEAETLGLVQLAVKDGATLSLTNVLDTFNLEPTAPTLTPKSNYDATAAATFAWTFNDPNPGDTQSAYELEIERTDTGASVVDTGKVVSATSSRNVTGGTLTNGLSYRWRVRTWDAADTVGPFSGWGTFSTSAGGTVTITDPATDNPAGVITDDYAIDWSVSGTTQAGYRVWLKINSSGATVSDTGWITSTATTHNVTGMTSGVEHRIEVKVRNASLVESGTGTRLITPDYGSPETPTIVVTPSTAGGYVEVAVTNPTPTGDRPEVLYNTILRRPVGATLWSVLGTVDPDGTFLDYHAAAGVEYEYMARGVA
ncbi:MAG TPA: hypothetical protein VFP10_12415 [Candidatus Eisenbacteria bacterium]|nr:hypothetical protein [Candidatus Eisenbacteria bacterium]